MDGGLQMFVALVSRDVTVFLHHYIYHGSDLGRLQNEEILVPSFCWNTASSGSLALAWGLRPEAVLKTYYISR